MGLVMQVSNVPIQQQSSKVDRIFNNKNTVKIVALTAGCVQTGVTAKTLVAHKEFIANTFKTSSKATKALTTGIAISNGLVAALSTFVLTKILGKTFSPKQTKCDYKV